MPATFRNLLQRRPPILLGDVSAPAIPMKSSMMTSRTRVEWDRAVVLSVARGIEPDVDKVMYWFSNDAICELGDKTAQQLVEEGATARLLDMLVMIRGGHRDR